MSPISREEIMKVLKCIKSNKAPGTDAISDELLKHGGHAVINELEALFNQIWEEKEVPGEW